MIFLGIETSCDDSSVGLYCSERKGLAMLMATQLEHREFGGIVPEIASRAHLKNLPPVLGACLEDAHLELSDIDAIAVTRGPGLLGSLLVGVSFARALGENLGLPVLDVHHIEAHLLANHLERDMEFPSLALLVSGGHSQVILAKAPGQYQLLATTRDDAAGEAFDKVAKVMGLKFPGGPKIEKLAHSGDPAALPFPRVRMKDRSQDFSFSGLKTAARLAWEGGASEGSMADFAASFQAAVIGQLMDRSLELARGRLLRAFYLAGGVAANRRLLEEAESRFAPLDIPVYAPRPAWCTDNGLMVACAGFFRHEAGITASENLEPFSRGLIESWAP
ncbi:MAG: tRNA (adenosine(37)-N6)-threonylcarbamoyltransferase complex transferase subunit TsaD [Candidatus Krumholzibacteria bacterium]|jgi:N6-L-threonylcarbamoyladenine synthase|nr:tRNA (adenosine(37)-N6)-threonylcarbamoyltransferase complex transferase subunit TsaD [Candidatus Krumholzibacteria bacterium]MDP6668812.1 tRNA (adenosine(37)-N6)-threonylcarbamoyltransferase complex transferase subunit TsaD [Candidatus Krumholzibacteria bacterium]MDP6796938.1 tRNA (adenosine(37)-N6)-threonylcarbamoyltransferase complex transferase subunit TsaD [Candidatus Krumholzibacteria bacterium]MDP7022333.1 tRNA (adenosine(37)-N6)-threonylcarbamoyltransferase complex transferase subunit